MNTLKIALSYEFVSKLLTLTWFDILFAIKQGFLPTQSAVEHAIAELERDENPLQSIIDLACVSDGESIHPYIDELARRELNQNEKETQDKFLYILLSWVYEHKELFSDPLETVEYIYADFNYPEKISNFIRYMPTDQPDLGSVELNRKRLFNNWETFLNKQKVKYKGENDSLKL